MLLSWMSQEVSKRLGAVDYTLNIPHLLTIDPNFLEHPSNPFRIHKNSQLHRFVVHLLRVTISIARLVTGNRRKYLYWSKDLLAAP